MKKKVYLLPLAAMALTALAGCGQQDNRPVIVYRTWDQGTAAENNEERRLVQAFEAKENVRVKIVENTTIAGDSNSYWQFLKASIFNGIDVADVFMLPTIGNGLESEFLLNIKEYTDADEEFQQVPASIREACKFKSGVYAVPARMNLQGYFANLTVIEAQLGIDVGEAGEKLSVNSSYDKIEQIINAAANTPNTNKVFGLNSPTHFIDTMASVLDTSDTKTLGYFTWDGSAYHLDDQAFVQGVQKARDLFEAKKTMDAYTADELAEYDVTDMVDAWNKGKLALRYGATYEMPDMLNPDKKLPGTTYKFIGNPGGKISIVGDYYGIYKKTEKPELAYKFAKWMSFGKEGFKKRMELYYPTGAVNSLPLQNDVSLVNEYFQKFGSSTEMKGLEDAFEYIKTKSMVEGAKVVPNYFASRQSAKTGLTVGDIENATMFELLNACVVHGADITLYTSGTSNINTIANNRYKQWMTEYGGKYQ